MTAKIWSNLVKLVSGLAILVCLTLVPYQSNAHAGTYLGACTFSDYTNGSCQTSFANANFIKVALNKPNYAQAGLSPNFTPVEYGSGGRCVYKTYTINKWYFTYQCDVVSDATSQVTLKAPYPGTLGVYNAKGDLVALFTNKDYSNVLFEFYNN